MPEIGYALSSEEHSPNDLVRNAQRAEEAGFAFALISDHYHPWIGAQGHSPFVWSVIGAIAHATDALRLGTGVTCPTMRIHPTILAQAAATSAAMMPGRFFFGVGTGENLNEHVQGERWYPFDLRLAMLEEAVEIIRMLWEGDTVSYWGDYYTVEDARLFTLPDTPPPIYVAASGENMAEAAGYLGDGFISTAPKQELIRAYNDNGGEGPRIGQLTVCYAADKDEAKERVHKIWPISGLPGEMTQELRTVEHFEQAVEIVTKEQASKNIVTGPDPTEHMDGIQKFLDAGYDQVYIHQIGHEQDGFFEFYAKEILPHFQS
jgi:coenzyme F420-dependent glucose-6-phosphate dehydrogenase